MYRQPIRTGNQPVSLEATFCSALIHKMGWKSQKHDDKKEKENKLTKNKKNKLEDKSGRGKDKQKKSETSKKQRKKGMKYIAKKLKKITSSLQFAVRSSDAYERGVKGCETCAMEREDYKKMMQTMKVIEILVDGVIEKEQADLMDEDKENGDMNGHDGSQRSASKESQSGKGDRLTIQCEVISEKKLTEHNLKCILIKLQENLGDILVQISFVKTRKLSNEERYKKFDVSVSDLKQLRFEYTNLTDKIILLFKKPSAKTSDPRVCVTCVKERLTGVNHQLEEGLQSGRNLKLVMRNLTSDSSDQCCSRAYPHVHAEVQGKPIVLKYFKPLQKEQLKEDAKDDVPDKPLEKSDIDDDFNLPLQKEQLKEDAKDDVPDKPLEKSDIDDDFNLGLDEESGVWPHKSLDKGTPYTEWPNESEDAKSKDSDLHKESSQEPIRDKSADDSFASSESDDDSDTEKKTKPNEPFGVEDEKSKQSPLSNTSPQRTAGIDDQKPNVETKQKPEKKTEDSESFGSSASGSQVTIVSESPQEKPDKKIEVQQKPKTNFDSLDSTSLTSSDSDLLDSDTFERDKKKPLKRVSFSDEKNPAVLYMTADETTPRFPKHSPKENDSSGSIKKNQLEKEGNDTGGTSKTPFGGDGRDVPVYIAAKDSFVLINHRLSHVANSTEKKPIPQKESTKPQSKDITHPDKKVEEVLNSLGKEKLKAVSSPADSCYVKSCTSFTDLPLEASLSSLPLDQSDLNYIAQLIGEKISLGDIRLVTDEDIPIEEYEWETLRDNPKESEETKWLRSLAGTESPSVHSITNDHSTSSEQVTKVKWTSLRTSSTRDGPLTLPTIAEESAVTNDKVFHIPYMPSIPSLPLDEDEKRKLSNKKPRQSILKNRVMELRYFTVEFRNKPDIKKTTYFVDRKSKSAPNASFKNIDFDSDKGIKMHETIVLSKEENEELTSCESFLSCHSTDSLDNARVSTGLNGKTDTQLEHPPEESLSKAVDEMIMMNLIYMNGTEIEKNHAKGTYKFSNTSNSITQNKSSEHISGSFVERSLNCKRSYILDNEDCKKEIDKEAQDKTLKENKTIDEMRQIRNQSYTIIKILKENNDFPNQNHPACNKDNLKTNFQPIKTNKSYTVIKNCNGILRNSNIPSIKHKRSKSKLKLSGKKSYTIIRKDQERNRNNNENQVKDILNGTTNYSSLQFRPTSLNQSYTIFKDRTKVIETDHKVLQSYPNSINMNNINVVSKRSCTLFKNREKQVNQCYEKNVQSYLKQLYVKKIASSQQKQGVNERPKTLFGDQKIANSFKNREIGPKSNIQNFNVKNYIMLQAAKKIDNVHSKVTSSKIYRNLKRKPIVLTNSNFQCIRVECKITKPLLQFATLKPIYVKDEVPETIYNTNPRFQQVHKIANNEESGTDNFISDCRKLGNKTKETELLSFQGFGIEKGYIRGKKSSHAINTIRFGEKQGIPAISHENEQIMDNNFSRLENNTSNTELLIQDSSTTMESKDELVRVFCGSDKRNSSENPPSSIACLSNIAKDSESYLNRTNEYYLIDHNCKPLHLFDIHGRPLTDNSGRPLCNINGDLLVKCNEVGIPISDAKNNPIFDTYGYSLHDYDFNPTKSVSTEVLKNFTTNTGKPLLLFDTEGRPLTSVSGTMLLDCSGKSLIRFNCTGKPVSDFRGRPVFDLSGRTVYD